MFSFIVEALKCGKIPDLADLRRRFNFAMIKKTAILNLPYHFWHNDCKINPLAAHLLWAACLLEDEEALTSALDVIVREKMVKENIAGDFLYQTDNIKILCQPFFDELEELAPDSNTLSVLVAKRQKAEKFLLLP